MNILKPNPIGVDVQIQRFQTYLYNRLKTAWNISNDNDFVMYGRVGRNQTNDGYTPEAYMRDGSYKDVYWDNSLKALSFFGVKSDRQIEGAKVTSDVFLIFMVNCQTLKNTIERKDEEIRQDVLKLCLYTIEGFELKGYTTEPDKVFAEYSGWKKDIGMKFRDVFPYYCFRLNYTILYPIIMN